MSSLKKVNLSSLSQLSNTADENLGSALGEFGYQQSFKFTDFKLALGYSTVLVSGGLFLLDKKYPFHELFNVYVVSIIAYFLISGVLFYFSVGSYKNLKYTGYNDDQKSLSVATWTTKYDPVYNLKITFEGDEPIEIKIEFKKFYDAFGYYNRDSFIESFQTELAKFQKKTE